MKITCWHILQHLEYPLDVNKILRKKKSIKKDLLLNDNFIEKKIAVLGGSTTSEIKNILELFDIVDKMKAVNLIEAVHQDT